MLSILDPLLLAAFDQLVQIIVGAFGCDQHIVVDYQVIAGPVGGQRVAVNVQYMTTGCFDTGSGGKGAHIVGAAVYDLQVIQLEAEEQNYRCEQQHKQSRAKSGYSFHASPPKLLMAEITGYMIGAVSRVYAAVRRKPRNLSPVVSPKNRPRAKTASSYTGSAIVTHSIVALKHFFR